MMTYLPTDINVIINIRLKSFPLTLLSLHLAVLLRCKLTCGESTFLCDVAFISRSYMSIRKTHQESASDDSFVPLTFYYRHTSMNVLAEGQETGAGVA